MDVDALFEAFAFASQVPKTVQLFDQICAVLDIDQNDSSNLYKRLKSRLKYWRAEKLWAHLDKRAECKEYSEQRACRKLSILVVGAGPCGLRAAIECALLGAHVFLVEQRECFARNNVLHIWPFVIQDLKNLGIKVFYPKFCRGSIDHISIRQLQCALLKVALVLGVQFHNSVAFQGLIFPEPDEEKQVTGWRAEFNPGDHILSELVFDALIGADGKRNTIPGFPKREMRGKLAIGITANFVNRGTVSEEKVQEISGVAYIFNQKFFNDMKDATDIDLENIVYYKDETHYFVMCAKKQSLLDKGVIIQDFDDVSSLLSPENVDQEKLCSYAMSAADFATTGKLPDLKFARNHNGREDVAMFDFTSLFSAQCSVRLVERCGRRLLISIVGDSLHEPFWPTGSGCARGFLGVFDVAWMLRSYGLGDRGLMEVIAERESIYRLLAQAKPENLHKQLHNYSIDPRSRYLTLEMTVQPNEVCGLVDTDNPRNIEVTEALPLRVDDGHPVLDPGFFERHRLLKFCQQALQAYRLRVYNFDSCWEDGRALAALLAKFRPKLVDYIELCCVDDKDAIFEHVGSVVESEYGIEAEFHTAAEWCLIGSERRESYVGRLVSKFEEDTERMEEILLNSIRACVIPAKRNAKVCFDASGAKKSERIQKRTNDLLSTLSSKSTSEDKEDRLVKEFLEGRHEDLGEQQIREALAVINTDESHRKVSFRKPIRDVDLVDFEKLQRRITYGDIGTKNYTKRPAVDKLNPERLYVVEKIITGEIEAEKLRELYRMKQKTAELCAHKMDQRDIDDMETKLEQTAMGLLVDKQQFRVITSKEEKIMSANAAAARQAAQEGFKKENERYKDVDQKLLKADQLLKNSYLAGVDTVSRMRQQNVLLFADRCAAASAVQSASKPPPPPPKKVALHNSPNKDQENNSVCTEKPTREVSPLPATDSTYHTASVGRQQECQLCSKPVYLAERMQVEGLFIHKKCFRCAYCDRPLRIGECAQDRNLEKYNPKFFCTRHLNLHLSEKIARIEKLNPGITKRVDRSASDVHPTLGNSSTQRAHVTLSGNVQNVDRSTNSDKDRTSLHYITAPNTPSSILEKTMERMRIHKGISDVKSLSNSGLESPERVKFETFKKNLRADISKSDGDKAKPAMSSTDDPFAEFFKNFLKEARRQRSYESPSSEEEALMSSDLKKNPREVPALASEASEDSSSCSDEEFMEADLVELEQTVLENINKNLDDSLSEAQAVRLLESFNRRRTMDNGCATPKAGASLSDSEFFQTPRSEMRNEFADDFRTPATSFEFRTPTTSYETPKSFETPPSSYETPKTSRKQVSVKGSSNRDFGALTLTEYRKKGHARNEKKLESSRSLEESSKAIPCTTTFPRQPSLDQGSTMRCDAVRSVAKGFGKESTACVAKQDSVMAVNRQPASSMYLGGNGLLARLYGMKQPSRNEGSKECLLNRPGGPSAASLSKVENNTLPASGVKPSCFENLSRTADPSATKRNGGSVEAEKGVVAAVSETVPYSPISFSRRNIRRVQKRAEQIVQQKERERVRTAQDLQRSLQETEIRKAEVTSVGADLEKRLLEDCENRWVLEQWMLYVCEMEQLKLKEEDLVRRVQEIEVVEEYRQLQRKLKTIQQMENGDIQAEKRLLQQMLEVIEKRNAIQEKMDKCKSRSAEHKVSALQSILEAKGYSYRNFSPFFLK